MQMADQTSAASVIRIGISILAHVVRTHSLAKSRVVRAGNAVRRTCCHNTIDNATISQLVMPFNRHFAGSIYPGEPVPER